MTEQTNGASLYRKLAAIAGELETVEKDGRNKDQGYTYATPASVFRVIKPLLARHKVAIVPMQAGRLEIDTGRTSRSGSPYIQHIADMTYLILDGESGEMLTATWTGVAGTYGDDKGNAKAQTIALRTFLIQLFQIPADDPDHDPDARDPRETDQRRGGAAYEPRAEPRKAPVPTGAEPKRGITREQLVARFLKTLAEARAVGLKVKEYQPESMSDADIIKEGTELRELIQFETSAAAT